MLFVIGLLLVTNYNTVHGSKCLDEVSDDYFERQVLTRESDVFKSKQGSGIDCGGSTITATRIEETPVYPSRRHGSSASVTNHDRDAVYRIIPARKVFYRCRNTGSTERGPVFIYAEDHLHVVEKRCPASNRAVVRRGVLKNDDFKEEHEKALDWPCVGRHNCDVWVTIPGARYWIKTDCRPKNYALHCCDAAGTEGSELHDAKNACGLTLLCECCSRQNGDKTLGIRDCGPVKDGATRHIIGINPDNGTPYSESNDSATDELPDEDEDGCHVRKATVGNKVICIPGNMARILSIIDYYSHKIEGGRCMVHSVRDDKNCTNDIFEARQYLFAVRIELPGKNVSANTLKQKIREKLEDEDLNTSVYVKERSGSYIVAFGL